MNNRHQRYQIVPLYCDLFPLSQEKVIKDALSRGGFFPSTGMVSWGEWIDLSELQEREALTLEMPGGQFLAIETHSKGNV